MSMAFNLLIKEVPDNECTFKTMDSKVATVNEKTGEVTAVATGTTFIKLYNKKNDLSAAVKINVTGEGNLTFAKVIGGYNHFVALKGNGEVYTWGYNANGELGLGDNKTEQNQHE